MSELCEYQNARCNDKKNIVRNCYTCVGIYVHADCVGLYVKV